MSANAFTDLLMPGESLLASMEAPGQPTIVAGGEEQVWWQVGLTPQRVLAMKLVKPPRSKGWTPSGRLIGQRATVRVTRFPRTPQSSARVVIEGCGEDVVLVDVDTEQAFGQLQGWLTAWGGAVGGAPILPGWNNQVLDEAEDPAQKRMLYGVVGVMVAFMVLCCGCGVASVALRALATAMGY